jgi:hypothetical protein
VPWTRREFVKNSKKKFVFYSSFSDVRVTNHTKLLEY